MSEPAPIPSNVVKLPVKQKPVAASTARRLPKFQTWRSYAVIPAQVLLSPDFKSLSAIETHVLIYAANLFKPKSKHSTEGNNGAFILSSKQLAEMGYGSRQGITNAIAGLRRKGLLVRTKGHGPNGAAWYAVTWRPVDQVMDRAGRPLFDSRKAWEALMKVAGGKPWGPRL